MIFESCNELGVANPQKLLLCQQCVYILHCLYNRSNQVNSKYIGNITLYKRMQNHQRKHQQFVVSDMSATILMSMMMNWTMVFKILQV